MVAMRGDGKGAVIVEEQRQRKEIKPTGREAPWRLVLLNIDNVASSVYVAAVPGAPAPPEVRNVLSTACTVKYQLPADEGDDQVTGYHLQRDHVTTSGDAIGWETVSTEPITALEFVVDQLKPLSEYRFRVAAENKFGIGDFSLASHPVKCPPDLESANIRLSVLQRYTRLFIRKIFIYKHQL